MSKSLVPNAVIEVGTIRIDTPEGRRWGFKFPVMSKDFDERHYVINALDWIRRQLMSELGE